MQAGELVVLTQEEADNRALASLLEPAGLAVLSYPCIATKYRYYAGGMLPEGRQLSDYDLLLYTSRRAVTGTVAAATAIRESAVPVACVGQGTAQAVRMRLGTPPTLVPQRDEHGAGLAAAVAALPVRPRRVLYFRGSHTTGKLQAALRDKGIIVDELEVYANIEPELAPLAAEPQAGVFASPSAVRRFFNANPELPRVFPCFAIGPTTSAALERTGAGAVFQSPRPDKHALAATIISTLEANEYHGQ
jgi:uroporphyrinogen-III synthase